MTREAFNELVRDVPDRVRLSPAAAWADARRRWRRRRVLAAGLLATAVLGVAVGLANSTGADRADPAPSPGATFVRAVSDGDTWKVTRSDGTTLTIDPKGDFPEPTLGLSPDGRWLSYAQGPESGTILTLYLLRSDQIKPHRVAEASGTTWGFAHQWSPDSQLVLVPAADGDERLIDTDGRLVSSGSETGASAGFVDNDSLGSINAQYSPHFDALTWEVTDLESNSERSLSLEVDPGILRSPEWPTLHVQQASLSLDGSRVAALLTNYRGQARILTFSTANGALIDRHDSTDSKLQLACPFRWEAGSALLPRHNEDCVVKPK